ncbi:hypothetical protein [Aurantimonas sp. VKM B-3413]|uniref:hypothetical protein n=1 Tax=Aurantimonas sp. VKM B-3413 TaxID=2779401 RepID=UPI001E61D70C|nr:hypothetical protein [Aurantimonas sp. VKM B-3413]MCB8840700.1 hypothetical protein [Aurantimonas sp. VKM B-3413]
MNLLRALTLGALMIAGGPAVAQDAENLVAVSNTAMSITGDVTMDDFGMTFENGDQLAFDELVADSFTVDGQQVAASLYSVKTPGDPVLLNGNRLCGQGKVTYVASWGTDLVMVAVFTTQDVPQSDAEMCASYTYEYRQ